MVQREPRTELRILHLASPQSDSLAAACNTKVVMVTGWYLMWHLVGFTPDGERLFRPVWKARIIEVPDRFFNEFELRRIL